MPFVRIAEPKTPSVGMTAFANLDALPQPIGEFRPIDEWQIHINALFYGLRGSRLRDFYQTFVSADYRLAHALAVEYYRAASTREEKAAQSGTLTDEPLFFAELGCRAGNLVARFLSHLQRLDAQKTVYPRVRYIMADLHPGMLEAALAHPDLAAHRSRVETRQLILDDRSRDLADLDFIICNEWWSELPTKLMLRKEGAIEEEYVRPNLNEARLDSIADWSGFLKAFERADLDALRAQPPFLDDLVWERDYRKVDWKAVPFRKSIADLLKQIDEKVLIPVNLGACQFLQRLPTLLRPQAVGLSSFDAGMVDIKALNDPDKPCYGQFGGQFTFMVNFPLTQAIVDHVGGSARRVELQRDYVGSALGSPVLSLMDLLAIHPKAGTLVPWEQEKLTVLTIQALNTSYRSPYQRTVTFNFSEAMPAAERQALEQALKGLKADGVPDTVAYVTEEEVYGAKTELEALGYDLDVLPAALSAPAQPLDYYHFSARVP